MGVRDEGHGEEQQPSSFPPPSCQVAGELVITSIPSMSNRLTS